MPTVLITPSTPTLLPFNSLVAGVIANSIGEPFRSIVN